MADHYDDVDQYIQSLPEPVQPVIQELRRTVLLAVPRGAEAIRYAIPTVLLDGSSLVHYAAWKHHVGLYPLPAEDGPAADGRLAGDLQPYRTSKGTARFPLSAPLPLDLISRIVRLLVRERQDARRG